MTDMTPLPQTAPPPILGFAAQTWQELLEELHGEFAPSDFFERTWLRDIAILTRRIDELRMIEAGLQSYHLYCLAHEDAGSESVKPWTHDRDELAGIAALIAPLIGISALTLHHINPAFARFIGISYEQRIEVFSRIQSQIMTTMLERDRVVNRYSDWVRDKQAGASTEGMLKDTLLALGVPGGQVADE